MIGYIFHSTFQNTGLMVLLDLVNTKNNQNFNILHSYEISHQLFLLNYILNTY